MYIKKTSTRILAAVLVVLMLVAAVPISAVQATDATAAQLTIDTISAIPGETIELIASLENAPLVKSMAISNITYDTDKMVLTNVEWLCDAEITNWNPTQGRGVLTFGENTDANGSVLKIVFKINDVVEDSDVSISCTIKLNTMDAGDNEVAVDTTVIPGKVEIRNEIPGDMDGNEKVNSNDAVYLLYYTLFGKAEYPIKQSGDVDGNGKTNSNDAVYLLYHVLFGEEEYPLDKPCSHSLNYFAEQEATCTDPGSYAYWHCTSCGKYFSDESATTEITFADTVIPATGHTVVIDEAVLPTYTSTGLTEGSHCSVCNKVLVPQEVTGPLTKDTYSIQYVCDMVPLDENGAPISIPADTYKPAEGKTLYLPKMDKYKFLGWSDENGKMYGMEIPKGTTGDLKLYANWASDRNRAVPVSNLGDPIICEDSEKGQILFIYEIGQVKNIPIFETQDLLVVNGIVTSTGVVKQTSITEGNAQEIGKSIANTTTNSSTWTFSSDWTESMSVTEEWATLHKMDVEEANEFCKNENNTYNMTNSIGGSSGLINSDSSSYRVSTNQAHSESTYSDEQRYASFHIDGGASTSTTVSSSVSAGLKVPLGPASAEVKTETGVSNTTSFDISASYDQSKYTQDIKTGTDSWSENIDMSGASSSVSTSEKTWNSSQGYTASYGMSKTETVSKAVSNQISKAHSSDSSYTTGGSNGESKDYAFSNAENDLYSSSVTYSNATIEIAERTFTSTGNTYGAYRLVVFGTARVFAVVGYDIKNSAYYTYTYSVLDDDGYKEDIDYSYDRTFSDYETSVLPFEIPGFVNDYVNSRIASSKLQISDDGVVTKYLGSSADKVVLIPSYYVRKNTTTGENEMIKITGIAPGLFKNNTNIVGVSLGQFVNEIPASAFEGCTSLKEVICPNVVRIGANAFKGCSSLSEFSLPNEIESIGEGAFDGIPAIKSNAPTIEIANAVAKANAQNITLDISRIEANDFSSMMLTTGKINNFTLFGGYKEYKGLHIKSEATTTVISGVTISETVKIPLEVSSSNLTLERVTAYSDGFALVLKADTTVLSIEGVSRMLSESTNSVLAKNIVLSQINEETYSAVDTNGNVLVCGTVVNNDGFIANEKIVSITEYDKYLESKKITFDANGGTVLIPSATVTYGSVIEETPIPEWDDYTFLGWFDENGIEVRAGDVIYYTEDTTLKARWKSGPVLETAVPDGAEIVAGSEKWTYDVTTTVESNQSVMDGYELINTVYGDWSEWSTTEVAESDGIEVEVKEIVDKEGYYTYDYMRYCNKEPIGGHPAYSYTTECTTCRVPQGSYADAWYEDWRRGELIPREIVGTWTCDCGKTGNMYRDEWVEAGGDMHVMYFEVQNYHDPVTHTEYRYRDCTYYHSKTETLESAVEVIPSDTVSNVNKYVQYVIQ
ncbi:MAG: leucine-rich repeat protein [Clostridia bacterium]|nr:leucine-rich repeat protein [Clostridia bacterium]